MPSHPRIRAVIFCVKVFDLSRVRTENPSPPRIKCRAGFLLNALYCSITGTV
jgi:hypothetical protein